MLFADDIGIDLGTSTVIAFRKGQGIVLYEPSVVAIEKYSNRLLAIGEEAKRMLGRNPDHIAVIRPLRDGVIADYETTERMLIYFVKKILGKKSFFKPRIVVCIPTGATDVEERAAKQAAIAAGARQAFIIEEPLAAAIGAGINIEEPMGNMVVDIGGGTSDIAVLSLGGIVCGISTRVGGDKFDEALIRYIRRKHNMMIGERTAEEIKLGIGNAYRSRAFMNKKMEVRGRDLISGLPKVIEFTSEECLQALQEPLENLVASIRKVLEVTPPELASDISNNGIVMTGGGSLLNNLDQLLSKETHLPIHIAEEPINCVALGTGKALEQVEVISKAEYRGAKRLF